MEESGKPHAAKQGKKEGDGDDGDDGAKGGRMPGSQSPSTPGVKTKPKLEDIIATIATLSDTVKSGFADQKISNGEVTKKLDDSVEKWNQINVKVAQHEEVSLLSQRRLKIQELRLQAAEKRIEVQERESRQRYMLIEGVQEGKDEIVNDIVDDLFNSLKVGFGSERCNRAQRRGKLTAPPGKTARPRPIIISFIRVSDKASIFKCQMERSVSRGSLDRITAKPGQGLTSAKRICKIKRLQFSCQREFICTRWYKISTQRPASTP